MYSPSIFSQLLKAYPRHKFERLLRTEDRIKQSRKFSEWDHLVSMIYSQLTSQGSLRQLVSSFNEHYSQHYHLGVNDIRLSTLSFANRTRDVSLFSNVLSELIMIAGHHNEARDIVKLLDSTPILLKAVTYPDFAKRNGAYEGIKLHIEYDLNGGFPTFFEITPGNINDITVAQNLAITPKATYVFDRGYMKFSWWQKLDDKGCRFVSRIQKQVKYDIVRKSDLDVNHANVKGDVEIKLTGKKSESGFSKALRLITVQLDDSHKTIEIVSNDLTSSALEIANLYKRRWEIELLFKWIKQKLKIKKFMGESENAVKIQIITALITFLLLAIYKQNHSRFSSLSELFLIIKTDPFRKLNHRQIYEKQQQYRKNNLNQLQLL